MAHGSCQRVESRHHALAACDGFAYQVFTLGLLSRDCTLEHRVDRGTAYRARRARRALVRPDRDVPGLRDQHRRPVRGDHGVRAHPARIAADRCGCGVPDGCSAGAVLRRLHDSDCLAGRPLEPPQHRGGGTDHLVRLSPSSAAWRSPTGSSCSVESASDSARPAPRRRPASTGLGLLSRRTSAHGLERIRPGRTDRRLDRVPTWPGRSRRRIGWSATRSTPSAYPDCCSAYSYS